MEFLPDRLDVRAFAEQGATLEGADTVADHDRLLAESQGRGGSALVQWRAHGQLRNPLHVQPEVWLELDARTVLSLTCQRCLEPVEVAVEVERAFRFVADEATAAAEDDAAEEDLLALSRSFDLRELIEDELLMALPVAPRHPVCSSPLQGQEPVAGGVEEEARPHPFAVLGRLKINKP